MVTEVWQAGFYKRELDQKLGRDRTAGRWVTSEEKFCVNMDLTFKFWLWVNVKVEAKI